MHNLIHDRPGVEWLLFSLGISFVLDPEGCPRRALTLHAQTRRAAQSTGHLVDVVVLEAVPGDPSAEVSQPIWSLRTTRLTPSTCR